VGGRAQRTEPVNPPAIDQGWNTFHAQWVDWFNHHRLYEHCGDIPPIELEAAYYAQHQRPAAG